MVWILPPPMSIIGTRPSFGHTLPQAGIPGIGRRGSDQLPSGEITTASP